MEVKHVYSGKNHFFEVKNGKEVYSVVVQANCTCKDFTIIKCAHNGFCKHIKEVMKEIGSNKISFEKKK